MSGLNDILKLFYDLIGTLMPILISLAMLVFLWGVLKYIRAGDNPEERANGRQFVVNGIVLIFVMVSIWGLVNVLENLFGLNDVLPNTPPLPTLGP